MKIEIENKMYKKCLDIAMVAHKGQTRWNGEPYINHPVAVAEQFNKDEIGLKCMALLHDVIEDTFFTSQDLQNKGVYSIINYPNIPKIN